MHDEPERAWTVPELALLSAKSRPSFARNFERGLGQSPMHYLTDWRLTLARDYLLAGELKWWAHLVGARRVHPHKH
jgi:transcriptional regulator GlxA family with amidase domain